MDKEQLRKVISEYVEKTRIEDPKLYQFTKELFRSDFDDKSIDELAEIARSRGIKYNAITMQMIKDNEK